MNKMEMIRYMKYIDYIENPNQKLANWLSIRLGRTYK